MSAGARIAIALERKQSHGHESCPHLLSALWDSERRQTSPSRRRRSSARAPPTASAFHRRRSATLLAAGFPKQAGGGATDWRTALLLSSEAGVSASYGNAPFPLRACEKRYGYRVATGLVRVHRRLDALSACDELPDILDRRRPAPATAAGAAALSGTERVEVVEVVVDSPADRAGLRTEDLIVEVGETRVERVEDISGGWAPRRSASRSTCACCGALAS